MIIKGTVQADSIFHMDVLLYDGVSCVSKYLTFSGEI